MKCWPTIFDSSIPVLLDEITDKSKLDSSTKPDLKLSSSEDKTHHIGETDTMESLNISLEETNDMESLNILQEEANDMESLNISLEEDESIELDHELDRAVEEINQHEPDTALALAKAYIELGEEDIAKDFLRDVISGGDAGLKSEAEEMLAKLG